MKTFLECKTEQQRKAVMSICICLTTCFQFNKDSVLVLDIPAWKPAVVDKFSIIKRVHSTKFIQVHMTYWTHGIFPTRRDDDLAESALHTVASLIQTLANDATITCHFQKRLTKHPIRS